MPFNDLKTPLRDILESIVFIEEFVLSMDIDAYRQDAKTQAAVERKMLVISEAAKRFGEIADRLNTNADAVCPGVPWRDIRGIGNWLRHQYDRVNSDTVWNTIQKDLPVLHAAIAKTLATQV